MQTKRNKVYFGKEVNDAIVNYNDKSLIDQYRSEIKTTNDKELIEYYLNEIKFIEMEKERLFTSTIYPALNKLVENIIHKWKFYNYETNYQDLKTDVVSFLFEQMHKYKPETGSKAYSYLTIVARNYLILRSQQTLEAQNKFDELEVVDDNRDIISETTRSDYQEQLHDFLHKWCDYVEFNFNKFFRLPTDKLIGDSILEIFRVCHEIDMNNKKMLYILIKERSGISSTVHITKNLNKLKKSFYEQFEIYRKTGKMGT